MPHILDCRASQNSAVFTREIENEKVVDCSLEDMISGHFDEFQTWRYHMEWRRGSQSPCGRQVNQVISDVATGYLDNSDCLPAIDTLSSPNLTGLFPGTYTHNAKFDFRNFLCSELVRRMLELVWSASDNMSSASAHGYLKKLFESQQMNQYLPEILNDLKLNNRLFGWSALIQVASSLDSAKAFNLISLLLTLFRDEAVSRYPKMNESYFAKLAGFDQLLEGSRSRRGEDTLGNFIMVAFRKGDHKMAAIAHEFIELAYMCVLQTNNVKLCETFLTDFYENALLKNTTTPVQTFFFNTSGGSNASIQLAFQILKLKAGIGSGLRVQGSPVSMHLSLLKDAIALAKTKVKLTRELDELYYAAFNVAIRPLFSPPLSTFTLGDEQIPWMTLSDLENIKDIVLPALKEKKKVWNPYLVPYRVLCGKAEIDVIVISTGSSSEAETPMTKRTRYDSFEIEID